MELEICPSRGFLFFLQRRVVAGLDLVLQAAYLRGFFFLTVLFFFVFFFWGDGIFLQLVCTSRGAHWPGIAAGLFCTTSFL